MHNRKKFVMQIIFYLPSKKRVVKKWHKGNKTEN